MPPPIITRLQVPTLAFADLFCQWPMLERVDPVTLKSHLGERRTRDTNTQLPFGNVFHAALNALLTILAAIAPAADREDRCEAAAGGAEVGRLALVGPKMQYKSHWTETAFSLRTWLIEKA